MPALLLGFVFIFFVSAFLRAGLAMILIGIVHHDVIPAVPAFGLLDTFILVCAVQAFTFQQANND